VGVVALFLLVAVAGQFTCGFPAFAETVKLCCFVVAVVGVGVVALLMLVAVAVHFHL